MVFHEYFLLASCDTNAGWATIIREDDEKVMAVAAAFFVY